MLGSAIKKRKKIKEEIITEKDTAGKNKSAEENAADNANNIIADINETLPSDNKNIEKKDEDTQRSENGVNNSVFSRFADILNVDEKTILEECELFEIKNVMSKISRAVVRYGLSGSEIKALVNNACSSGLGGIAVAPAYIRDIALGLKGREYIKVCAVIDFPFGEASFKVKMSEIKNAVKQGVDGISVVFNASAIMKENFAIFKKQLKKIGRVKGVEKSVAVSAEDMDTDNLKRFIHLAGKTVDHATFLFGNVSEEKLHAKMQEITKHKGDLHVKVMANVENVYGVKTLIKDGVDEIVTPYADEIAKELFKEFEITGIKLM